jgi:hypothetical protein
VLSSECICCTLRAPPNLDHWANVQRSTGWLRWRRLDGIFNQVVLLLIFNFDLHHSSPREQSEAR